MTYSVTKIQSFRTPDGDGFNCVLLRDGKPVCEVHDAGHGGCYQYSWMDSGEPRVLIHTLNHKGEPVEYSGTPEEELFRAHCDAKLPKGTYEPEDQVVAALADRAENVKRLARQMRKKVFFTKSGKDLFSVDLKERQPDWVAADILRRHPTAKVFTDPERLVDHAEANGM